MNSIKTFAINLFKHFSSSNTLQEGAALAYYTVFSLLPMLVIVTSVFGLIWGESAVSGELYKGMSGAIGHDAAEQLQNIVKQQHLKHNGVLTTIMGTITLLLGATGMFNQLHTSFNNIWRISGQAKSSVLSYFSKHAVSFGLLIVTFFLLFLSLSINSILVALADKVNTPLPIGILTEHLVSIALFSVVFALMFKNLGDAKVDWSLALTGGLFTSIMFTIGKFAIGLYIGSSSISSTFGAASVIALLMVWVYYTSQILFLGASFVYVLAETWNKKIVAK